MDSITEGHTLFRLQNQSILISSGYLYALCSKTYASLEFYAGAFEGIL